MPTLLLPNIKTSLIDKYSVLFACCLALYSIQADSRDFLDAEGRTNNQQAASQAIFNACTSAASPQGAERTNSLFYTRCDALVPSGLGPDVVNPILGQVTSEQTASQNTRALEMNNTQLSTISNRMALIRSGRQKGGLKLSGLMFDNNGTPLATNQLARLNDTFNKAAAGDNAFDRLGVFVNGNIGFGDRRTTSNEAGYNLNNHGMTAGADYRISNNFLLGLAFSYDHARSGYLNNLGKMETDTYTGAIYGSFFTDNGFFVDGIFSGGHSNYASSRNIRYTIPEVIDTQATGKTQGNEFDVAMTTGFNFHLAGLTVTPQVRVDYTTTQVDALTEQGGDGWALHIADQTFESLQTAPGLQLAYAVNLPWAVIMPMVRAEYIHEFQNNNRTINANYLGDVTKQNLIILTDNPDRDYIVASAGLSAQFAHGISAFANYDTIQAHSYVNNHNFSGGLRVELPF